MVFYGHLWYDFCKIEMSTVYNFYTKQGVVRFLSEQIEVR